MGSKGGRGAGEAGGAGRKLLILEPCPMPLIPQYGSVKARDAINRRLYKGLIIVKTAIYRVFAI
ncbi:MULTISPECIES: hypothetical protein [unclassified Nostoc]|uniref:hypothetical protein n=1 Tax=unclassified Nostoc TaxID=2593658 RepID=UPI002611E5AF|nr:hypothetical protein [Nostoc sp. S13]MDF5739761.1 hypothetical protein [Nostoc sp. S13]